MLRTTDFQPQDWLLIIEALTEYARLAETDEPRRADRADELAEAVAARIGFITMCGPDWLPRGYSPFKMNHHFRCSSQNLFISICANPTRNMRAASELRFAYIGGTS